jgi:hypothetical protein
VLERSFSLLLGGFGARLVRVAANAFAPGAVVEGRELARLRPPLLADNYEGIAATLAPDGTQLLWLLSDDNFMSLQRTSAALVQVASLELAAARRATVIEKEVIDLRSRLEALEAKVAAAPAAPAAPTDAAPATATPAAP